MDDPLGPPVGELYSAKYILCAGRASFAQLAEALMALEVQKVLHGCQDDPECRNGRGLKSSATLAIKRCGGGTLHPSSMRAVVINGSKAQISHRGVVFCLRFLGYRGGQPDLAADGSS